MTERVAAPSGGARPQVAFVGLGTMGRPMAANLARALPTVVWNRTPEVARDHAATHGTTAVAALEELGDRALAPAVVCSCLPTDVEAAEVAAVLGPHLRPGTVWLDHTSGDPAASRRVGEALAAHGVHYLDAPVSGGLAGAVAGELTVMVGGDADVLSRVRPVLDHLAAKVVHVGPSGAGMAVKAVNNALLAAALWAAGEGLIALKSAGVDPAAALEVINGASGRSFASEVLIGERVLTREFPLTFALGLLAKDVRIAGAVVDAADVEAPVLALTDRLTGEAAASLGADRDHVEMLRMLEQATGIEID